MRSSWGTPTLLWTLSQGSSPTAGSYGENPGKDPLLALAEEGKSNPWKISQSLLLKEGPLCKGKTARASSWGKGLPVSSKAERTVSRGKAGRRRLGRLQPEETEDRESPATGETLAGATDQTHGLLKHGFNGKTIEHSPSSPSISSAQGSSVAARLQLKEPQDTGCL